MRIFFFKAGLLAALLGLVPVARAQWLTQTVVVTNGWNAVYLYVDPSSESLVPTTQYLPIAPGNPIDQIWLWKVPSSVAQYLTDPAVPLTGGGQWVSWNQTNALNTLSALIPNSAYLIHSTANSNFSWSITGRPVPPSYSWDITGLNFVGFPTPATNPPNFQNYLAQAPAAFAQYAQIFQYIGGELSTNGQNPAQVYSYYNTPVIRGKAFWVSCTNSTVGYYGPFQVNLPTSGGLDYGTAGGQFTFHLYNNTATNLTVTMTLLASLPPPANQTLQTNIVAAPPLMVEGGLNSSNLTYGYASLSTSGSGGTIISTNWTLAPAGQSGSEVPVVLGLNRYAMGAAPGSLYAGVLKFTDSLGDSEIYVPVTATTTDNSGLWVGSAAVNQVSYDLKSYATNSDGSMVMSLSTNYVVATNIFTFGTLTNPVYAWTDTTNLTINDYCISNEAISIYVTNLTGVVTDGFVLSTNEIVTDAIITNLVSETDVTGWYFTNNTLLQWVTTNTVYGPFVTNQLSTNWVVVTNPVVTPAAGALVTVTNFQFINYGAVSYVVTNAPYEDPVTNVVDTGYSFTNMVLATNIAGIYLVTNMTALLSSVTNYSASLYLTTNLVGTAVVTTNYYVSTPLTVYTNGPNLVAVNVVTNSTVVDNWTTINFITNWFVTATVYTNGASQGQLVASNWFAGGFSSSTVFTAVTNFAQGLAMDTQAHAVVVTNLFTSSVSNYVVTAHNTSLDAVTTAYPLRLIVFNDSQGNSSLLQRVYYGLRQDTNIVVATTESVLDVSHLNTARRITATHLPWTATNTVWSFSGGGLGLGNTLTTTVFEPYDDQAANPFLHTYHPDHNNLDLTKSPPQEQAVGVHSYGITRTITLAIEPSATDFVSLTTANSSLAGNYAETITLAGLGGAQKSYQTAGTFTLKRISSISVLTRQ